MEYTATLDPTSLDKGPRASSEPVYSAVPERVIAPKPRASSLDTTHSSISRSDDQDASIDRSRGCSLDLLSPASASLRTGSMCSGMSSVSRLTECSAYTEHSRSDCEKITRRTAEREHNITRLLGVITIIFVISWSVSWGVILYNTLSVLPVPDSSHVTLSIARDLFLVNHFCNIVVYAVLSKSFRDKLMQCCHSLKICY
ncbi:uncharacterized protein LOC131927530 [Physella acuta]|uniref:uncharacterized protein LOC131927530 n=1 Tax=Physella acuta TaxID=109671 RepID=UPI0027DC84E2|nr:uncharacterized protein LOC131927530 [Physella acuta]